MNTIHVPLNVIINKNLNLLLCTFAVSQKKCSRKIIEKKTIYKKNIDID